jgi:GT2 family glycosyltransferase
MQSRVNVETSPKLSIIFVNWNSTEYLRACLASIFSEAQGLDFEIIVVDNASPSGDAGVLKTEFPGINLVESKTNLGFAGANNLGFRHSTGKLLLFLNPDTKIIGSAIQTMAAHLESIPGAGIVGCKLLNTDLSIQTSCVQRFPTILNQALDIEFLRLRWPACRLWEIQALFSDRPGPSELEVISGACLMIRREVFEAAGRFSEDYFMYGEDMDLCFKVRQAGFKNYYVGDASVIHYGGGSSKQSGKNQWATIHQRNAILQFCRKTRGPFYAWMYRAVIGMAALGRLLVVIPLLPLQRIVVRMRRVSSASEKWLAILKWAVGLERPS